MRYAQIAKTAADQCKDGLLRIVARVSLSYLDPAQRALHLQDSLAIAQSIESPELRSALESLSASTQAHAGMLEPLVRRYRQAPVQSVRIPLTIEVLQGRVSRNGAALSVSEGAMTLLIALALESKSASSDRLCALLWPDSPREAAGNALKMCVRRLRTQLDDYSVIDFTKTGYAVRSDTLVDLTEIFPKIEAAIQRKKILPEETFTLRGIFDALMCGRPSFLSASEWFAPTELGLCEKAHELGVLLARAAFERKDDADCRTICGQLLAADVYDEPAHELGIRLRVRAGDRGAAIRDFRNYRSLLVRELGVEPSSELQKLVAGLIA